MDELRQLVEAYVPYNEQEERDRELILEQIDSGRDILTRNNKNAHITVSGWVVSPDRKKVLMAYHNIYRSWAWLGGHADGDEDVRRVIKKEIQEDSGLTEVKFLSDELFSLEILTVDGHEKRGEYVSSHLHLNVTFLLEGDTEAPLAVKPDENSRVGWIPADEIESRCSEPWFAERIYSKLCEKVKGIGARIISLSTDMKARIR